MNNFIDMNIFLQKYNITIKEYEESGVCWDNLLEIYNDYLILRPKLENIAKFISDTLRSADKVHSIRYRTKDPEHLLEKIIRKKKFDVTSKNYLEKITDLIGIRALHLYKDDWESIHDFINDNWLLKENVTALVRTGDSKDLLELYSKKNCDIKEHEMGYRSVHYIIECSATKEKIFAEIQVRTIIEEAWSEIDHQIRYPYNINDKMLQNYLATFNRLAGTADEMGTLLKSLNMEFKKQQLEFEDKFNKIKTLLSNANIEEKIGQDIYKELNELFEFSSLKTFQENEDLKKINNIKLKKYQL